MDSVIAISEPPLLLLGQMIPADSADVKRPHPHAGEGPEAGPAEIERAAVAGPPAQTLIESAPGAELLVVGSRGRGGFLGLLLGSVSQQCAQHPPCPVVILPPPDGA